MFKFKIKYNGNWHDIPNNVDTVDSLSTYMNINFSDNAYLEEIHGEHIKVPEQDNSPMEILSIENYYHGKVSDMIDVNIYTEKTSLLWHICVDSGYQSQYIWAVDSADAGNKNPLIDVDSLTADGSDFCFLRECYNDWYNSSYKNQNNADRGGSVSPLKSWAKQVVLRDRNANVPLL